MPQVKPLIMIFNVLAIGIHNIPSCTSARPAMIFSFALNASSTVPIKTTKRMSSKRKARISKVNYSKI
jgi:hypothetical protein